MFSFPRSKLLGYYQQSTPWTDLNICIAIGNTMKAKVYVSLKPGILDPQGKAIQHSVELLGFDGIADVRQGKYFEIALAESSTPEGARESVSRMAREVLSNPIIEDYRVEIEA